jgi:hypothetical protein
MEILVVPPPEPSPEYRFECGMCGHMHHKLVTERGVEYFFCEHCATSLPGLAAFRGSLLHWNLPTTWHVVE